MLTPAHIAASYLLSQVPQVLGRPLESNEVILTIVVGNIIDIDFVFGYFLGRKGDNHHRFITHTPIFSFVVWLTCFVIFSNALSIFIWILLLISALLHLVLDDIGYWFCRLGWQEISKYPQINWLYPFRVFPARKYDGSNASLLRDYFKKARVNVLFEVILILFAAIVFIVP